jgi:hypothetical protein
MPVYLFHLIQRNAFMLNPGVGLKFLSLLADSNAQSRRVSLLAQQVPQSQGFLKAARPDDRPVRGCANHSTGPEHLLRGSSRLRCPHGFFPLTLFQGFSCFLEAA